MPSALKCSYSPDCVTISGDPTAIRDLAAFIVGSEDVLHVSGAMGNPLDDAAITRILKTDAPGLLQVSADSDGMVIRGSLANRAHIANSLEFLANQERIEGRHVHFDPIGYDIMDGSSWEIVVELE